MLRGLVVLVALLPACSDSNLRDGSYEDSSLDGRTDGRRFDYWDGAPIFTDAQCMATYKLENAEPGIHVAEDASVTYMTNPPSSGPHYPDWAIWGVHTDVVPREYYVHNLEHGGVVLLYRCDGDCTMLRDQLAAVAVSFPPDPTCVGSGVPRRILMTEDPLIDAPIAAAAWSWTYHAQCVDVPSLRAFVIARTGHAPEDFCNQGTYP